MPRSDASCNPLHSSTKEAVPSSEHALLRAHYNPQSQDLLNTKQRDSTVQYSNKIMGIPENRSPDVMLDPRMLIGKWACGSRPGIERR